MPIDPLTIRATRTKVKPDEYLNRVPNQDITEEEWQLLDPDQRADVRKSDLYDVKTNDEVKAASQSDDEHLTVASRRRSSPEPEPPVTVTVTSTDQPTTGHQPPSG